MAASEAGSRVSAREPFFSAGYRAALDSVAFLADAGRRVVAVSGEGAWRVVNGLVSNDVGGVAGGQGAYAYLLDRRGRVVVDLRVLPAPGFEATDGIPKLWLEVPAAGLQALERHLGMYVPPLFARHRSTAVRVVSLLGPLAERTLRRAAGDAGARLDRRPGELSALETTTMRVGDEAGLLVRREDIEGPGFDLHLPMEGGRSRGALALQGHLEAAVAREDGALATEADREVLRVELGLPAFGHELGPDRLAQEAGQESRAISFAKGCFTGQEVVARVHYRGHVNRHLRGIRWRAEAAGREGPAGAGDALPDIGGLIGADLVAATVAPGGRPVGVVTSAVISPRFGPIGLAYIRREIEPGHRVRPLRAADFEFEIISLPFTTQ